MHASSHWPRNILFFLKNLRSKAFLPRDQRGDTRLLKGGRGQRTGPRALSSQPALCTRLQEHRANEVEWGTFWNHFVAEFRELIKSARHAFRVFWKEVHSKLQNRLRNIQNVTHLVFWNVRRKFTVKSIIPQRLTIHPSLSRTFPVWKLEVPQPGNPLCAGRRSRPVGYAILRRRL